MLRNYYSTDSIDNLLAQPETLVVLPSDALCKAGDLGVISSGLTSLAEDGVHEVWAVDNGQVSRGSLGRCQWSKTSDVLCAAIWITGEESHNLEHATQRAYAELIDFVYQSEYQYPFRFWNYLPNINVGNDDDEQYKRFCTGRLNAFKDKNIPPQQFPAASALGHHTQDAVIYVFASCIPAIHHRNALQVNAYEYPREYGLSSPSFSRATSINIDNQPLFFISGTASIIGHESKHAGDLQNQLETTVSNVKHLLQHANSDALPLQSIKVYLRYAKDCQQAQQQLQAHFPRVAMIFVLADICRADLLVEVECFCY